MTASDQDPSSQLEQDLNQSILRALATGRPILTHLNADTTWLLSIAYPPHEKPPSGRSRYNILIDPWLQGPQSDIAGWFSTQWHAIASSVQTISDLNIYLQEIEALARDVWPPRVGNRRGRKPHPERTEGYSFVDAILISHPFTDHCHRQTLLQISRSTPVFGTADAVELVRSWGHFEDVVGIPAVSEGFDWKAFSHPPLPSWLGIGRLQTEGDALYYHSAITIFFGDAEPSSTAEAVVYTPHGVHAEEVSTILSAQPKVQTLALLHGLHDVSITLSKQLNLGAHNALKAQRLLKSKYWIGTHDEIKIGGGLLAPFLRRKAYTVAEALRAEALVTQTNLNLDPSNYVELGNGESLLLV